MAYDFEFLENLVFRLPSARKILGYIFLVSVIESSMLSFTQGSFSITQFVVLSGMLFSGMAILSKSITKHISYISEEWSLLVSSIILTVLSLLSITTNLILPADLSLLLTLGGTLTFSMLTYTLLAGKENIFKIGLISLLPVILFIMAINYGSSSSVSYTTLAAYLGSLLTVLCANKVVNEYFFQVNSLDVPGSVLAAEIINDIQCDLDMGEQSNATVRTFEVRNSEENSFSGFIPWIHPGPIASFGGSRIQERTIDEEKDDFFLHAPSTHESDLTEVEDMDKVLEEFESPEDYSETSTELIKAESELFTIYGRAYGNKKVLYLESDNFDDYERSIFDSKLEDNDIAIVDTHGGDRRYGKSVNHASKNAEELKNLVDKLITELEKSDQHAYHAGWSVIQNEKDIMALVEEVNEEKVLFLGTNENEKSKEMLEAEDRFEEDFDEVIVFTTDNHRSIYDQAVGLPNAVQNYEKTVKEADEKIEQAKAGLNYEKVEEVRLFNEHYFELMGSINILSRLYPTTVFMITAVFTIIAVLLT